MDGFTTTQILWLFAGAGFAYVVYRVFRDEKASERNRDEASLDLFKNFFDS